MHTTRAHLFCISVLISHSQRLRKLVDPAQRPVVPCIRRPRAQNRLVGSLPRGGSGCFDVYAVVLTRWQPSCCCAAFAFRRARPLGGSSGILRSTVQGRTGLMLTRPLRRQLPHLSPEMRSGLLATVRTRMSSVSPSKPALACTVGFLEPRRRDLSGTGQRMSPLWTEADQVP